VDILDRLLGHDAWTTRQLLLRCRELSDEQLDRRFDIGHRAFRATLLHMIRNMEVWTDLIAGQPVRDDAGLRSPGQSVDGLLRRLETTADELAASAASLHPKIAWTIASSITWTIPRPAKPTAVQLPM